MIITQSLLCEFFTYCPASGTLKWKFRDRKWFSDNRSFNSWNTKYANKDAFTAINSDGYFAGAVLKRSMKKHEVVWIMCFGVKPKLIDHIDGNTLNDSLGNLRNVGNSENSKNRAKHKENTTGFTGVYYRKDKGKFTAQISENYKRIHLGFFETIEEAIKARAHAEIVYRYHPNHGRNKNERRNSSTTCAL